MGSVLCAELCNVSTSCLRCMSCFKGLGFGMSSTKLGMSALFTCVVAQSAPGELLGIDTDACRTSAAQDPTSLDRVSTGQHNKQGSQSAP